MRGRRAGGAGDPAEARLWWLTLARLLGLLAAVAGLLLAGRDRGAGDTPWPGLLLALAGLGWFILVPRALLRRWRSGG